MDFSVFPVGPDSGQVLASVWSREVARLTVPEPVLDGFRGLTLSRLLSNGLLRIPYVIMFKDGRMLPAADYTQDRSVYGRSVPGYLDRTAAGKMVDAGATVVFATVEHWVPELSGLVHDLGAAWRSACTASIFCTPAHSTGLTWHRDDQHGVVLQVEGTKVWNVERAAPAGHWREEALGASFQPDSPVRLELRPGDALYLPPGVAHHPQTQDSASVHVTIGLRQVSVLDVALRLLQAPDMSALRHRPLTDPVDVVAAFRDALGSVPSGVVEDCARAAEDELRVLSWPV